MNTLISPRKELIDFIKEMQEHTTLHFPEEITLLLEATRSGKKEEAFEEMIALAKFIVKSQRIVARVGPDGEGHEQLTKEMESGIHRLCDLLREIIQHSGEQTQEHFRHFFFEINQTGFANLMNVIHDLMTVKNWTLDGHPLP